MEIPFNCTCGELPFLSPILWGYSMRMNLAFIINGTGIYFSSQEQIAYFLTQEAVHLLVHFKLLRVNIETNFVCYTDGYIWAELWIVGIFPTFCNGTFWIKVQLQSHSIFIYRTPRFTSKLQSPKIPKKVNIACTNLYKIICNLYYSFFSKCPNSFLRHAWDYDKASHFDNTTSTFHILITWLWSHYYVMNVSKWCDNHIN